jgi:hypothetical protein
MNDFREGQESEIEGTRLHWIWRVDQANYYNHQSVFISRQLNPKYEDEEFALHFDEGAIGLLEFQSLEDQGFDIARTENVSVQSLVYGGPVREVLDREEIPEDRLVETVLTQELRDNIDEERVRQVFAWITSSTSDNDTLDNFDNREKSIRERNPSLGNASLSPNYSGPLFLYSKDTKTQGKVKLERRAPINLIWRTRLGRTGIGLAQRMHTNGWCGHYNHSPATRYAIVDGKTRQLRTHGDEAAKKTGLPAKQWHLRLVEIPRRMDQFFTAAGSVHHDPWHHGKLTRNPNWRFKTARQHTLTDWNDWGFRTDNINAGNQDNFTSSDGKIGVVKPL